SNVVATLLCVAAWGYFVYQGTIDPLGGVNTIWPLFGISNQMLAGIALLLATTVLIKLKRERYAWVTLAPTAWLLVCTLTAGWMKAFSSDPRIGFYALANKYSEAASLALSSPRPRALPRWSVWLSTTTYVARSQCCSLLWC